MATKVICNEGVSVVPNNQMRCFGEDNFCLRDVTLPWGIGSGAFFDGAGPMYITPEGYTCLEGKSIGLTYCVKYLGYTEDV